MTLDGTENQQDASQSGDSSVGTKGTSETPETFTKEQKEKAAQDALSAAGRTAKALEAREQAVKAKEERAAQDQKVKDDQELEDARDDKERWTALTERHKHRDTKAELATARQELEAERARGSQKDAEKAETEREIAVFEIATKHTVSAETLKRLSKFTDGSTEAIEAIAQSMVKKGETKTPLTPDSGKTIGGGEKSEEQKLKERYPTM